MNGELTYYDSFYFPHLRIFFGMRRVWVLLMDLDRKDFALLDALQQNASQRLEDLAALVKLAPSSVHERLRRLEREGIIRRWTVDLDTTALGLGVIAFIGVRSTRPCSELLASMRKIPSIEE